jgi:peptidoglycan/LPS O-acetylase OafA/YrhL
MPGTDDAFWSLPFEFWYYIIFGLVYFTRGRRRAALVLLSMVIVGPRILLLFPIWLAGVAAYTLTRSGRIGPWLGWILWLGSFVSLVLFKHEETPLRRAFEIAMLGGPDLYTDPVRMFWPLSWILGAIVAANIIGFNAVGQLFDRALYFFSAPIRFLAGMTFAIYLFHYPLIYFFSTVTRETTIGATTMVAVFIGTPAVIVPLSLGCDRFKRWLTMVLHRVVVLLGPGFGAGPHTPSVPGASGDVVERHSI